MIRRPPRSTPLSLHDALPISNLVVPSGVEDDMRPPRPEEGSGLQNHCSIAETNSDSTVDRSEEHTSELQSLAYLVCRLLLEKKKHKHLQQHPRTKGPVNSRRH